MTLTLAQTLLTCPAVSHGVRSRTMVEAPAIGLLIGGRGALDLLLKARRDGVKSTGTVRTEAHERTPRRTRPRKYSFPNNWNNNMSG